MKTSLTFTLKKEAKRLGGDRYTCNEVENFDIYVPQKFSRPSGTPLLGLTLTIEEGTLVPGKLIVT